MTDVETQEPVSPAQSDPVANDDASSQSPGDESNIGDVKVGDTAQGKKVLAIRVTGTVKWFNVKNGYGFISRNDKDGEDVFVHQSAIKRNNPTKAVRSVGDGEVVEFDIVEGEKGNEAANVTGPGGTNVKGSPFAAERGRFYTGRARGGFRGRFRPRGPPREGGVVQNYAVPEGGQMVTSPRGGGGGFRGGRGRPYMARRRFYGGPGRPVGQPGMVAGQQAVDGQQVVAEGGNGYQQQGGDNYEQRQPRGRPRRYIQRFFRRRPRGRRGEGETEEGGAEGEAGEDQGAGGQGDANGGGEEAQGEGAGEEQGGSRPRGRGRYYRGRGGFRGRRPFRGRRGEGQQFEGEQGGDGAQSEVPNGGASAGGGAETAEQQ